MTERLKIHNFAGITEVDISLNQINVLIGPQAVGKSICAKSFYFFKSFLGDLIEAVETEQTKRQFDTAFLQKFKHYFPLQNINNQDFSLRYEIDDTFIQVEQTNSKLKLSYSDYYKRELGIWRDVFRAALDKVAGSGQTLSRLDAIGLIRRDFFNVQAERLGKISAYSQVFVPAGRSFFALLQNNIFSLLSSNKPIDPLLAEFGSVYGDMKDPRISYIPRDEKDRRLKMKIDNLVESILKGKHIIDKEEDFLLLSDGRKVGLANSSSGQQAMLPLAFILSNIPFLPIFGHSGNVVYIEEPEAHLFPTAQRSIINLIATIFNESKIPVQFIITTHSPYILAAFNNLIYAGNVSSKLPSNGTNKLKEVVPAEQLIQTQDIHVYSLNHGICESIISEETGLISTNSLDTVSDELAAQFDSILDIE